MSERFSFFKDWTRDPGAPAFMASRAPNKAQETLKRAIDILLSGGALIALSPALAILAAAVRLDSPGPVIFRQTRVGKEGKTFVILKFRSMVEGGDETIHKEAIAKAFAGVEISDDPKAPYKLVNDPRVTRIGSWLRRTSLDELPQLFNVLRGDMSLVGPRPMIPYELDYLQDWQYERFLVRPGITGLAQIKARGRENMDETLRLDVEYARSQSLWLDLKVICKTFPVVFLSLGAR